MTRGCPFCALLDLHWSSALCLITVTHTISAVFTPSVQYCHWMLAELPVAQCQAAHSCQLGSRGGEPVLSQLARQECILCCRLSHIDHSVLYQIPYLAGLEAHMRLACFRCKHLYSLLTAPPSRPPPTHAHALPQSSPCCSPAPFLER